MDLPTDDYLPVGPSPRELESRGLAESLDKHGLITTPVEHGEKNRCWRFFVKPVEVPGLGRVRAGVQVFTTEYVVVLWGDQEPARRVFASTVDAEAFLYALLILGDLTLAMSLPVWEAKGKPRGPTRANPSEPRASPKAPPKMTRPVSPTEFGEGNG